MNAGATWATRRRFCLGVVPILLTGAASTVSPVAAATAADSPVTISGLLTREGAECQALRTDKGKLFTLVGNLKGFKPGERVRVSGERLEVSTCQQGTTLRVRKIVSIK